MEQQIRFCTTSDGVRIAYATVGEGPPFVYVPGWVSHLELEWEHPPLRSAVEELAERLTVVRFDKRGTGLSDRNVSDYSVEARLRDLEAVADDLKLRRFAIRGLSEGGPIAIACAARHPRRVTRLVLFGTFARGLGLARPEVSDALVRLVRAEWGLGSETLSRMLLPDASQEDLEWFVKLQRQGANREDAAAMLDANYAADVSDLLGQVRAPTLVVHGRRDRAVPFDLGRELAGQIRGARFLPFEGGHMPGPETSLVVQERILEFVLEDATMLAEQEKSEAVPAASGPLTVLFTDVEGSTSLTQRLGDAGAREVLRTHERIVREALRSHGGSEVKTMGDGFLASFSSATRALECAIAMQRTFAEHAELAEEPVLVRVGLNAGEPIEEQDDLFGTAVIVAARITAKASGGEILASDVVRQLVAGKGFLFSDRGDTALRGFEDPVRLFEVRWREEG